MSSDTETLDPPAPASEPAPIVTATGVPPSDPPADVSASKPDALPAADAIAKAMLTEAEKAAAIEREELLANGVRLDQDGQPSAQPLPGFEPAPFDEKGALRTIASKNRAVAEAKTAWKVSAEETAGLKKAYDREVDGLSAIIRDYDFKLRESETQQPRLVPSGSGAQSCLYEAREGKPCPVCIVLKAADAPLPLADDTAHLEAMVRVQDTESDLFDLTDWIEDITGQMMLKAWLEAWTTEQRRDVALYCAAVNGLGVLANQPTRPAVLGNPHIAAAPGESFQSCKRCGAVLFPVANPKTGEGVTVVEGAWVGADCQAVEPETKGDSDEPPVDEVMRAHKVCLCQDPAPKDGRCTTCDGTITGPPAKKRKAR